MSSLFNSEWLSAYEERQRQRQRLADCSRTIAVVERHPEPEPLAAAPAQEKDSGRFLVRVTSVRKRLLDEDNLCEKYHVDCLRYSGLIPSDAPDRTHIEVAQRKCVEGESEHIIILIEQL